ncbi:tetraspanin Tsp2 family [Crassisporium funariophilum]|nr:tetraspanin Tsp2 family [Crassisporium funariophilum]
MDNNSPRASVISHTNSAYSQAGSTRHILADLNNSSSSDYGGLLNPPSAPFGGASSRGSSATNLSLTINYLPSKFSSSPISPGGIRNRKGGRSPDDLDLPKRGGGTEAFRSNESRMSQGKGKLRWNKFKWILFLTNTCLTIWSLSGLVVCLLTWFDVWENADVIRTGNKPELILSTVAACVGIFTCVIGWAGILLNNRGFLAWYTFLTWITFAFLVIPGYLTYKRRTFNLEGKINAQWSRFIGSGGRLRIQDQLRCCGYFSPYVEATLSQTCYARSILPGCKLPYIQFERKILGIWFKAVFGLVPVQLGIMIAGLLCSDHITYRFGKGMMPEAYRLNLNTMAVIMDNYANQLAEQYGTEIASDVLKRSQSNMSSVQTLIHDGSPQHAPLSPFHAKYESLSHGPDTPLTPM